MDVRQSATEPASAYRRRARRFLAGRTTLRIPAPAVALAAARQQHAALRRTSGSLTAAWQPVGPNQVASAVYGDLSGRISAIAIDPGDPSGNTIYLGTTGGGVWKSTNAAGPAAGVSFVPLTDDLSVFSANSGTAAIPSLSIGAVSIQPSGGTGILLAGTGDPNDAADSYYGSGLLRSVDGGATWTLIQSSQDGVNGNHNFIGLGTAAFAWSTASPQLVVAAISDSLEGDLVRDGDQNSVRGLYYSTDAGVTWHMSVLMDGSQTVQAPLSSGGNVGGNAATAAVWNPVRQRFYAAVRYHGYYESADGANWSRLTQQPATTLSLSACPTNPGTTGNPSCPIFRGALAVEPVTGDTFALTVDLNNQDQGMWRDICALSGSACSGGISFAQRLPSAALERGNGSTVIPQADYNLALAAVATNNGTPDTLLYVGTADLYRCSISAGCSLRNTTNATNACATPAGVGGAQHALAGLSAGAQPLLYLGNDGGLWRSTDGVNQQASPCSPDDATHFQNLNGGLGSLAEVISFGQHPTDANTLLVGLGANGTASSSTASTNPSWTQLNSGEGGSVAIDPATPANWYISTAPGVSIRYCGSGAACTSGSFAGPPTIGLPQVSNDASLIDPPWLLDPLLSSNIVIGTCRGWRGPAASGGSWNGGNAISAMFSGPQSSSCTSNPVVRSLAAGGPATGAGAVQNAGSSVLYAGMAGQFDGGGTADGHLYVTHAGGTSSSATVWTDTTTSPVTNGGGTFNSNGFDVSSITVDPHDATGNTVYATVMGFHAAHVYRSTDSGAHWTDISSNLPDAPANSIAIDPNDANTLYVALDTGVYVTTQVSTCTAANCWSIYGTALPNAPVVRLEAAGGMQTGDGRVGELRAATCGRGIWQIPLLTATTSAEPVIALSPTSLTFAAQSTGSASPAQSITLTNTGNAPLSVSSVTTTGDFNESNRCIGSPIAPSGTCTIQVIFLPATQGPRSGVLTVYGNVVGGQSTASLDGAASAPSSIILTPVTFAFPATVVGGSSPARNITIANTGTGTATLQAPVVSGDFRISANTCGASLGPSSSCTVAVVFSPITSGVRGGNFTENDSVGTQTAYLSGTGTSPATDALSPAALTYAAQPLNTVSAPQQVTITNSGDTPLTLINAQITSGDFSVVNGCGASLNGRASCAISVSFVPKHLGNDTGVLTVTDQFRSQTVSLDGTGIAPAGVSLAPASGVDFGAVAVGIASTAQTVTLTNNGGQTLTLIGFAVQGDFAIVPGSNTCGSTVAVGAACTLQIIFSPTASGTRSGQLSVSDNGPSSPQVLPLTGLAVDFTLTASVSAATVTSGQSAVFPLLLTSAAGTPGAVTFTCTGRPSHSTCTIVPVTVNLGTGTVAINVTVATGTATAALERPPAFWLAVLLLPFGLGFFRLRPRGIGPSSLLALCLFVGLIAAAGCGTGRTIPGTTVPGAPGSPTPTPSGSSTIVVSATSASLVRSVNLTLTVQ